MTVFVHGEDFVVSGTEDDMKQVQELFCEKYITKVRGIVGPDPSDMKAIVILNRILQWTEDGITLEADQRHVELILKQMEMERCNGSEITGGAVKPESDGEKLNDVQGRHFRSMAARCNFMASDRVDLQFACKEICRRMSVTCDGDWSGHKKVARYLKAHPRMLMEFKYQKPVKELTVLVDTDYGGCKRTRRSTNGGIAQASRQELVYHSDLSSPLKWRGRILQSRQGRLRRPWHSGLNRRHVGHQGEDRHSDGFVGGQRNRNPKKSRQSEAFGDENALGA